MFSSIGFILNSCKEDIVENNPENSFPESPDNISGIKFTASDFKYSSVNSRTNIDINVNGAKFSWASNDTIGIFPDEGSQVYFPMESGAGTNTASFTGGGWALKSSSKYAAYYPLRGEFYLDKKNIPLSYEGQIQTGNGTTGHLGAYDYMGAVATIPEDGNVNFGFKHLGALVQLNIPMDNACTLENLTLSVDKGTFVTNASLDLTSESLTVTPTKTSEEFTISLNDFIVQENNKTATVYFMMHPVDLSSSLITVQVNSENDIYQYYATGKDFKEGYAYSITASNKTIDNEAMVLVTEANESNGYTAYLPQIIGSNITIDWGDGTQENYETTGFFTHKYSVNQSTSFEIKITGDIKGLNSKELKIHTITDVKQWGKSKLTYMDYAFYKNYLLKSIPNDSHGAFEYTTSFFYSFSGCSSLISIPLGLFDYCHNVTDFRYTFYSSYRLSSIPSGLFDNCTKVTSFIGTFSECEYISSIPSGLFDNCVEATDFGYTFCDCSSLRTIPSGLFDNCSKVDSFTGTFDNCFYLSSIPSGLFDNCTEVTDFIWTFKNCYNLKSIPTGLFDNCTKVKAFSYTFYNCYSLLSIPSGLFNNCPKVTNFGSTFEKCSNLSSIPSGLFDNCLEAMDFSDTFNGCISLESIPTDLFDNNRKAARFYYTFAGCSKLIGESPYTIIDGVKYHLYDRYKNTINFITPEISSYCFGECTGLSDYNDIPSSWK